MNIKKIILQIFFIITTFLVVDIVAYVGFSEKIKKIFVNYAVDDHFKFGREYPKFHHKPDKEIGFDIREDFKTLTSRHPVGYGSYPVWGNSYGCFDREWEQKEFSHDRLIYLAGDSVTWGYARFEKKFGTILEQKLGSSVFKCGVTHTGQLHQFSKFKRLFETYKIRPKIVVITVVGNDIKNDYFFPHTTVIDGYQVENIEICHKNNIFSWSRLSRDILLKKYSKIKNRKKNIRDHLRQYSLSATVIAKLTEKIRYSSSQIFLSKQECNSERLNIKKLGYKAKNYGVSKISFNNRKAILDWSKHAKENKYQLVLSFFASNDTYNRKIETHISEFYKKQKGVEVFDFIKYVENNIVNQNELYHTKDGHYSDLGNFIYAEFLHKNLEALFSKEN